MTTPSNCEICGAPKGVAGPFCQDCSASSRSSRDAAMARLAEQHRIEQNMKCLTCGNDNSVDDKFCGGCGTVIGEPSRDDSTIVGSRKSSTNSDSYTQSFFDTDHLTYLFGSEKGRINRQRYFFGMLLLWAVAGVVGLLLELFASGLSGLLLFILFPIMVILGIKRVHETNHSGWFLLFCFYSALFQLFTSLRMAIYS